MLVTALNPHIGYEKAAKIALAAHHEGLDTARGRHPNPDTSPPEQFDQWVKPEEMTHP